MIAGFLMIIGAMAYMLKKATARINELEDALQRVHKKHLESHIGDDF